jgi:hypothetical protein
LVLIDENLWGEILELDIKRGHFKNIEGDKLPNLMKEHFGNVKKDGEKLISNFGAMKPITVELKGKKALIVEIVTDKDAGENSAMETIRARNSFLLAATGFTTKERSKRLQKKAKEGKL